MAELAGNNIVLESVKTTNVKQIIDWSIDSNDSYFRLNSVLPISSEDLILELNASTRNLFVVKDSKNNNIGLIKSYNINTITRRALLSFTMQPSNNNTKLMQEATEIIIDRLFTKQNMTKIYTHTLQHEKEMKSVLAKLLFKKEGSLKEHLYMNNKYYNMDIFGLTKEDYYQ